MTDGNEKAQAADDGLTGGPLFFAGDHRLEGVLEWPESGPVAGGVVVAHPHPLRGGTMAQPVVYRIAQACRQRQLATLRFNFRGVGESLGFYSGAEEYKDVQAAASYLDGRLAALHSAADFDGIAPGASETAPGTRTPPLALAGYSFGSAMTAMAAAGTVTVRALALVGFVVSWVGLPPDTLSRLAAFRGPVYALCAENDDLASPDAVQRVLTELQLDFTLEVIEGADHFLEGKQREAGERVATFVHSALSAQA